MSANLFKINCTAMLAVAVSACSLSGFSTPAYAQCCEQHGSMQQSGGHAGHQPGPGQQYGSLPQGGGHAGHQTGVGQKYGSMPQVGAHASHQHGATGDPEAAHSQAPPDPTHGGQVTKMKPLTLEVVYRPQEMRVYVYSPTRNPESVKGAKGEVAMQVHNDARVVRVPLLYVAPPADSEEQDYLAAAVDLSNVRDGNMKITFNLENVPLSDAPKATFTQTFALSKVKLHVALAAVGQRDKAGIARQKVCPVTGAKLGGMGDPVKVFVDGQPLYLCCQGCVARVENYPETYLAKVSQSHESN